MSVAAPELGRVLCATDLSELGNRAVPLALAITRSGGRVTLLHVLRIAELPSPLVAHYGEKHASPEELAAQERAQAARLAALAAEPARAKGVALEMRVVRAARVAEAILAEARRSDAEALCLATHSRGSLAELVLGSTAHDVLQHAHRPVLLVPPPRES